MSFGARWLAAPSLAALLLVMAIGGCSFLSVPFGLRTAAAPADACMDALIGGTLVRHPASGLGIRSGDAQVTTVEWPFGYTARDEGSRIALVDEKGRVVAREGDRIFVGGGFGTDVWYACGPVSVPGPNS